jgi:hypothetical protein
MNCQNCTARIDYRFLTSCAYCGSKVDASGVSQIDPFPELQVAKRPVWKVLISIAYTIASSAAGLISGTVAGYGLFVVIYQIFFRGTESAHTGCCNCGILLGMLSVFGGAYLGSVGGAVFSIKRPLL